MNATITDASPAFDFAANPAAPPSEGQSSPGGAPFAHLPDGRVRRTDLGSADRTLSVCTHLWWVLLVTPIGVLGFLAPFVVWLAFRGKNHFVSDHGLEAANLILSLIVLHLLLAITVVGVALMPVLWIYTIVGIVRAAIAAGNGEYFRYPVTIRML